MKYININDYGGAWMFADEDIPISETDIHFILPIEESHSAEIWSEYISEKNRHPMLLSNEEWPSIESTWNASGKWQEAWNSDSMDLPIALHENLCWHDDDIVYFMYCRESVIETIWSVFKRTWKCFLFEDEGPFLFNAKNNEVVHFGPLGELKIGKKS